MGEVMRCVLLFLAVLAVLAVAALRGAETEWRELVTAGSAWTLTFDLEVERYPDGGRGLWDEDVYKRQELFRATPASSPVKKAVSSASAARSAGIGAQNAAETSTPSRIDITARFISGPPAISL